MVQYVITLEGNWINAMKLRLGIIVHSDCPKHSFKDRCTQTIVLTHKPRQATKIESITIAIDSRLEATGYCCNFYPPSSLNQSDMLWWID